MTGIALALVAGFATARMVLSSVNCRDFIGRLFQRGPLLALVHGKGIYETDLKRESVRDSFLSGQANTKPAPDDYRKILDRLIVDESLRRLSRNEPVPETMVKREVDLLSFEFADQKHWIDAMRASGISSSFLRRKIRSDLQARKWIEQHIAPKVEVDDQAAREYFQAHTSDFAQPIRLRARHIFLAAPAMTPPDVVELKKNLVQSLATRLANGEDFSQLAFEASEDEATKNQGGDLGYFSRWRMPEEFFETVSKYRVGEIGKPFRSRLGFHIVQVTEIKPPQEGRFEDARLEIVGKLADERRQAAVQALAEEIVGRAGYVRR